MALKLDGNLLAQYANPDTVKGSALGSAIQGGIKGFQLGTEMRHKEDANTRAEEAASRAAEAHVVDMRTKTAQAERVETETAEFVAPKAQEQRKQMAELGIKKAEQDYENAVLQYGINSNKAEVARRTKEARINHANLINQQAEASIASSQASTRNSIISGNLNAAKLESFNATSAGAAAATNAQNQEVVNSARRAEEGRIAFQGIADAMQESGRSVAQSTYLDNISKLDESQREEARKIFNPDMDTQTSATLDAHRQVILGRPDIAIDIIASQQGVQPTSIADVSIVNQDKPLWDQTLLIERVDGSTFPIEMNNLLTVKEQQEKYKQDTNRLVNENHLQMTKVKENNKQVMQVWKQQMEDQATQLGYAFEATDEDDLSIAVQRVQSIYPSWQPTENEADMLVKTTKLKAFEASKAGQSYDPNQIFEEAATAMYENTERTELDGPMNSVQRKLNSYFGTSFQTSTESRPAPATPASTPRPSPKGLINPIQDNPRGPSASALQTRANNKAATAEANQQFNSFAKERAGEKSVEQIMRDYIGIYGSMPPESKMKKIAKADPALYKRLQEYAKESGIN